MYSRIENLQIELFVQKISKKFRKLQVWCLRRYLGEVSGRVQRLRIGWKKCRLLLGFYYSYRVTFTHDFGAYLDLCMFDLEDLSIF
jgi:hypothetical protein